MSALDQIAGGAWTRLRNLIGSLDRVDRLETSEAFSGWLEQFSADDPAQAEAIREFLLRALRLAADPINFDLISGLSSVEGIQVSDLAQGTRLSRIELVERLNELSRAGLTVQSMEGDEVRATELTAGFTALIIDLGSRIKALASNDYLINRRAPAPQQHLRKKN